jgi:MFS family permease
MDRLPNRPSNLCLLYRLSYNTSFRWIFKPSSWKQTSCGTRDWRVMCGYSLIPTFIKLLTSFGPFTYFNWNELLSHWILPNEKSLVFNVAWSGGQAGTIFALGTFPYLAYWARSWHVPFYIFAALGIPWALFWIYCIFDTPASHPRLNPREKILLATKQDRRQSSHGVSGPNGQSQSPPVPWLALLTSPPLYVLMCIYFTYCWTFYLLISYLPMYLTYVLGYQGASQGLLAMAPYIGLWISLVVSGLFSDHLIKSGLAVIVVRKLMVFLGLAIPAIVMLLLGFFQSTQSPFFILVALFIIISMSGISMAGYSPNPMDLSPTYAGIITSLGNIIGGSSGIFSLFFTGYMLDWGGCTRSYPPTPQCLAAWSWLFAIGAGFYLLGTAVWLLFLSVSPLKLSPEETKPPNQLASVA